jgi:hypothetical protein
MATLRSGTVVGSAQWITAERDTSRKFADDDVADFSYSAQNEMEWLNEHMDDIFTKNQLSVAASL